MFKFEELRIYQDSIGFSKYIYGLTKSWPKDELFSLTNQFRRAVVSISLNIAEGSSRSKKDFAHFLDLSRGSCYECVSILKIAYDLNYLSSSDYKEAYAKCEGISRMLSALKKSVITPSIP